MAREKLPLWARALAVKEQAKLHPAPGRARMTLHFDVKSAVPASKERVAQIFAQQVKHALQADHAFTLDYLRARATHDIDQVRLIDAA